MTDTRPPTFTFVIPARNAARTLHTCLASVMTAAPGFADLIVVDNGSTDGTGEVARKHGATVVTWDGTNAGGARNVGARAGRGEALAFVDADHELETGWLDAAMSALVTPGVGAAGAQYVCPETTWVQRAYDGLRRRPVTRQACSWLGAGNLVVWRQAFEEVGGFDESLEACEDVELCRALRSAGYQLVAEPAMRSIHHGDPRNLVAVFRGELWRGRDNLRVSLRAPRSTTTMITALLPLGQLAGFVCALAGLAWSPSLSVILAGLVALPTVARAGVMARRRRDLTPGGFARALSVAVAYDLGRALSPVIRATHKARAA